MTICCATLANIMYYRDLPGPIWKLGPFSFSPSSLYISVITALMTALPATFFGAIFQRTTPQVVSKYGNPKFFPPYLSVLRKLCYFCCGMISIGALTFSVFYSMTMDGHAVKQWIGAQIVSIVMDILLMPFIRVMIITTVRLIFGCDGSGDRESIYVFDKSKSSLIDTTFPLHLFKSPKTIFNSKENKIARHLFRQAGETKRIFIQLGFTIIKTICYYLVCQNLVPNQRYHVYHTVRTKWDVNLKNTIHDINPVIKFVNLTELNVNYPIFSTVVAQYRKACCHFLPGWMKNESPVVAEDLSPLASMWVANSSLTNKNRYAVQFPKEELSIVGQYINSNNWIDNRTESFSIEQKIVNQNVNVVIWLRGNFHRITTGNFKAVLLIDFCSLGNETVLFYLNIPLLAIIIYSVGQVVQRVAVIELVTIAIDTGKISFPAILTIKKILFF